MEQETKVCKCCGREQPIFHYREGRWGHVSVCYECTALHRIENRQKLEEKRSLDNKTLLVAAKNLRLSEFTPRELMVELKRRGYEGKLVYMETHTIDLSTL